MSPRPRGKGELDAVRPRLIHVWNTDPDVTTSQLAERFGVNSSCVWTWLAEALKNGETTRAMTNSSAAARASAPRSMRPAARRSAR